MANIYDRTKSESATHGSAWYYDVSAHTWFSVSSR